MHPVVKEIADSYKKPEVVAVKSGDTVRVHQKIKEGNKERIQVFEGLVIRVKNRGSHTASILVRRDTGGYGVEKSYLLHSPLVTKVEVVKRGKVRRNYLTYMRGLRGKKARLIGKDFDKSINDVFDPEAAKAEAEAKAAAEKAAAEKAAKEAAEKAELEKKQAEVEAAHNTDQ